MWQVVVLIPKMEGNCHVIGLVEAVWKVVTVVLNFYLTTSIAFHNVLHRFRAGRGTGNATLEVKLLQ